jgi:hypothetical protein
MHAGVFVYTNPLNFGQFGALGIAAKGAQINASFSADIARPIELSVEKIKHFDTGAISFNDLLTFSGVYH